jgi:NDP-sugar pyrophosphorylase family protein
MKPMLVVMAAGLGSRYGGLKQIDPVDDCGQILIDYAIYDARQAGFEDVICVIKPEMEADFEAVIGRRIAGSVNLRYAFQTQETLPPGFAVPAGRTKPWGTGHAVLCAKPFINRSFAVINADDLYGRTSFQSLYAFLCQPRTKGEHAMVGYRIENTLTEHGTVARGVCDVKENGQLKGIVERLRIEPRVGGAVFAEAGHPDTFLPDGTTVSMNLWGFQPDFVAEVETHFTDWLRDSLPLDLHGAEYFLPYVVDTLLLERAACVAVLPTAERWHGVTYREDMARVREAVRLLREAGLYPRNLWEG